jgi:hypothetical protein
MSGADAFSDDYRTARTRFRAAATAAGFRLEDEPTGRDGPAGEPLAIDVARIGDPWPSRALVVSSGLHGVEGFFGSAVQTGLLEGGLHGWSPSPGVALVLVHALNPYGFAHVRRFNEENIDLNRNFLTQGAEFRGCSPRYADVDAMLNPRRPPNRFDFFTPRALGLILRYGLRTMSQAVAGGQYEFPLGLFFGGRGPAPLQGFLAERLPTWVGTAQDVLHLDFHTGLGRWAEYELLLETRLPPSRMAWLVEHFGAGRVRPLDDAGNAYQSHGSLGPWCEERFPDRTYTTLCAEFGTYPPVKVLAALRAENQAHHWAPPESLATRAAKSKLMEAFAPADRRWRDKVVAQGVDLIRRALNAPPNGRAFIG